MRVSAAHPIKDSAVWTVCVDSLHGQPEWTVCVDGLYGQSAWTVYMDSLCGQPVGQSAWRACMDNQHRLTAASPTWSHYFCVFYLQVRHRRRNACLPQVTMAEPG
jgi:hypothetical protein